MIRVIQLFLMMSVLSLPHYGQSSAPPPRSDNQFWNETQLIVNLNKKQDLVLIGGIRIGQGWSRPVDERIGAGLAFKINKYLTIQPTYLFIAYQPFPGREFTEHRAIMNVTGKFKIREFTIADRNLIEQRIRPTGRDFTTYRNRLMIDHPVRLGRLKFNPFVSNEAWYTTQPVATGRFGWSRNRFGAGILKQFTPKFYAEFLYLRQNDGLSRPGNIHSVMTFFRYTL